MSFAMLRAAAIAIALPFYVSALAQAVEFDRPFEVDSKSGHDTAAQPGFSRHHRAGIGGLA